MPDDGVIEEEFPHSVEWSIEKDGYLLGKMICIASEGAQCRLSCPEGCENWPCSHQLADHGTCNAVEWAEAATLQELYVGPDHAILNGPVVVTWDTDSYVWEYPDTLGWQSGEPVSIWIDGLHYKMLIPGEYEGVDLRRLPTPPVSNDREIWEDTGGAMMMPVLDDTQLTITGGERFVTNPRAINNG